jgi:hypothetical protein
MNATMQGGGPRRSLWKTPALITAIVLLIAVLGNRFVAGWNWELRGFVLVGSLVFGVGLAYQLITRNLDSIAYRAAAGIVLAATFALMWGNFIQAADDVNPAAVMYFGVPIVAIIGAAIARLRPTGMMLALFATALAQGLVMAMALIVRNPQVTPWSAAVLRGFGGNALFLALFLVSALLFRRAGREQ